MSVESYSFYFSLMRLGQGSEVEADLSAYEIAAEKSKKNKSTHLVISAAPSIKLDRTIHAS
jgi:hypothetical protein